MKVLIVDDNLEILEILSIVVEEDGHTVRAIEDADQFFTNVDAFKPDLILLDIMLGKHDGRQLCADLKSNHKTKNIPVVMISASHSPYSFKEKQCQPDGFIPKPFDITEVTRIVNQFL
jgi:DNA-binding response OmpR family regulator